MAAHLRGQAYLTAHRGQDAALEFQKIVDHRGIVLTSIIGALSQVGLARAFILQGDILEGPRRLRKLLQAWKGAVAILAVAKSEYASFADYSNP
jgi:hypothetical protein